MRFIWTAAIFTIAFCPTAWAQSSGIIERVKITDGELSCKQIYDEIGQMDKVMGVAQGTRDASSTASTAADVAQAALPAAAQIAAQAGNYGGALGLAQALPFASLFGGVARGVAQQQQSSAQENLTNAKARKEHLTTLFLGKGCKLAEVTAPAATPPAPQP